MKIDSPSVIHKIVHDYRTTIAIVFVIILLSSVFLILNEDRSKGEYENTPDFSVYGTQSDTPFVYNGEERRGVISDDWYTLSGDISAVDVGTYTVIATLSDPVNTSWSDGTTEPKEIAWSIAKARLNVIVDNYSIIHGEEAPVYTYAYNGFMYGDNASNSVTGTLTLDCAYSEGNPTGEYCIFASGLQSFNYNIIYENGTLFVTGEIINLPTAYEGLIYSGFETTGVLNGGGYSLSNNVGKDAGRYTTIASLIDNVNTTWPDSTNKPVEIIWTIGKAPLVVTIDEIEIRFGDSIPEYTCICNGFTSEDDDTLTIDNIVYECEYSKYDPVKDYVISASGLNYLNYEITYIDGILKVGKCHIQIPEVKSDLSYNGFTQNGILTGDGYVVIDNDGTNPGVYQSVVVLVDSMNTMWSDETIADITVEWVIEKAPLIVTAGNKRVEFGDDIPIYTCTYVGLILGDLEYSSFADSIVFNCEYNEASLPGDYIISLSGIMSLNYSVTYEDGVLTVTEKTVSLPVIIENLIYDGTSLIGVLEGSGYTIVGNTGIGAGSYTAIATLTDTDNAIWADLEVGSKTIYWNIGKAPLSVLIDDFQIVFGDEIPRYNFSYRGFVRGDDETSVTGSIEFTCEYIVRSNIGDYTISASGLDSPNYAISYVDGTLTVEKRLINPPVVIIDLVYNGEEQTGIEPGDDYYSSGDKGRNAGTYGAFVTLNSNATTSWEDGTIEGKAVDWNIAQKPLSSEMLAPICTQICTGTPVEPIVLKDDIGELKKGTDYTVSYDNNTSEGMATALVAGIGNYTGKVHSMFNVLLGYLVEYNLNGFIGTPPENQVMVSGSVLDLTSTPAPIRAGYTFIGWALSSVGEAITEHKVTENVTLYALWDNSEISSSSNLIIEGDGDESPIVIAMAIIALIDIVLVYLIFIRRI